MNLQNYARVVLFALFSTAMITTFQNCSKANFTATETQQASSSPTATSSSANSCTLNGNSISDGYSVVAYAYPSATASQACVSQTRTCTNGALSGSYLYSSCTPYNVAPAAACNFNGTSVASGNTVRGYLSQYGDTSQPCTAESRTCTNGSLSGSYPFSSCTMTYYKWTTNRAVLSPCGGPEEGGYACTPSNYGQTIVGNYCASGADAVWTCGSRYTVSN